MQDNDDYVPTRWQKLLDIYILKLDESLLFIRKYQRKLFNDNTMVMSEPNSGAIIRFTIMALLVVFFIVLTSCASMSRQLQTNSRSKGRNLPKTQVQPALVRPADPLYIKKQSIVIKSKEVGSKTGSIWADTNPSATLYAEERPNRNGESITILIPEDLRYTASAKDDAKKAQAGGNSAANVDGNMTNPYGVGIANRLTSEPLKDFRMEIVGIEPTGDVFLRGSRNFVSSIGDNRQVMLLAKIPKRALQTYSVDARELTSVTVNEISDNASTNYASSGWDRVVSRKLSGFIPDVDSELSALEDVRSELAVQQNSLKEQRKAINDERSRFLKERAMLAAKAEASQAAASAAQAQVAAYQAAEPKPTPVLDDANAASAPALNIAATPAPKKATTAKPVSKVPAKSIPKNSAKANPTPTPTGGRP